MFSDKESKSVINTTFLGKRKVIVLKKSKNNYDVLIIGAGPAGATAATILAEHGRRVLVVEKETFPRYHIGESLLPYCYFTLERLGLIERLNQSSFVNKYSVQFVSPDGDEAHPFYFFKHLDHPCSRTWQVLRSEFDLMLIENARSKGADIIDGVRVKDFIDGDDCIVGIQTDNRDRASTEYFAPITVDASGRDALAVARHHWRVPDQRLKKVAIWTYYKGARRDPGIDEGATTIAYVPHKGWIWYIPLGNDTVSVGVVADRDYLFEDTRDTQVIFEREVDKNRWIRDHLVTGTVIAPCQVTADYSFCSRFCARNGLVLAGDALSFIDPVFSSGLFLALKSGELVADAVDTAITAGDYSAGRFAEYGKTIGDGTEVMRKLVYAFYDRNFSFGRFIDGYPHLRGDLTDCLIGHLFRDFDPLFTAISEFAELPEPLPIAQPMVQRETPRATG